MVLNEDNKRENIIRKTKIYIPTTLTGNMDKHYIPVLQDLIKAIYSDRLLSRLADSGNIVIYGHLDIRLLSIKIRGLA